MCVLLVVIAVTVVDVICVCFFLEFMVRCLTTPRTPPPSMVRSGMIIGKLVGHEVGSLLVLIIFLIRILKITP